MKQEEMILFINAAVRKSGELLMKLAKDPRMRQAMSKADGSPVTPADLEVSQFLVEELAPLGFSIVSEESLPASQPRAGESYFLIDPVDGTKYFARGEDEYAICVGLIKEGKPYYGAIFDPIVGRLFWAVSGQGAYCDEALIQRPKHVGALRVYSSGFHKKKHGQFLKDSLGIGSIFEKGSALKFCDIAIGAIDLYIRFGPTSEWDTAGAQVLLSETGCDLIELQTMKTLEYGKKDYLNRGVLVCEKSLTENAIQKILELKEQWKKNEGQ